MKEVSMISKKNFLQALLIGNLFISALHAAEKKEKDLIKMSAEEEQEFSERAGKDIHKFNGKRSRIGLIIQNIINPKAIRKAIALGADVNVQDKGAYGNRPLHWAIESAREL